MRQALPGGRARHREMHGRPQANNDQLLATSLPSRSNYSLFLDGGDGRLDAQRGRWRKPAEEFAAEEAKRRGREAEAHRQQAGLATSISGPSGRPLGPIF